MNILDRLAELERAATPAPWGYDGMHNEIFTPARDAAQWFLICSETRSAPDQEHVQDALGHRYDGNFALIAESRNALPVLLEIARAAAVAELMHPWWCLWSAAGQCQCGLEQLRAALAKLRA